jgi:hypothetical protein
MYTFLYSGRIQRKTWCIRPYAETDYNFILCPLKNRHGQPYARVDLDPMTSISQSGTLDLASIRYLGTDVCEDTCEIEAGRIW